MNPQDNNTPAEGQLPPVSTHADGHFSGVTRTESVQSNNMPEPQGPVSVQAPSPVVGLNNGHVSKSPHAPTIADDNDLIEKEWVTRAKLIIAKTKEDPHEQSEELFKYKADYIKKRYNKDLKASES